MRTLLVRRGESVRLPKGAHTLLAVYAEMMLQIARLYPGLPDPRTLDIDEIRFFYNGARGELIEATKNG